MAQLRAPLPVPDARTELLSDAPPGLVTGQGAQRLELMWFMSDAAPAASDVFQAPPRVCSTETEGASTLLRACCAQLVSYPAALKKL